MIVGQLSSAIMIIYITHLIENRGVHDPRLFEGDMILTPEQRRKAEMGLDVDSTSSMKRGSHTGPLWPDGVLIYTIEPALGMSLIIKLTLFSLGFFLGILF